MPAFTKSAGAARSIGLPFTAEAERAIAAHAAANPRGRHGGHHYRLEDWGLERAGVHAAFSFYTDRFGVEVEH